MDPETPTPPAKKEEVKPAAPGARKYKFNGKTPKNEKVMHQYGNTKLRPWAMNDDEIDALIKRRPELSHLWQDLTKK